VNPNNINLLSAKELSKLSNSNLGLQPQLCTVVSPTTNLFNHFDEVERINPTNNLFDHEQTVGKINEVTSLTNRNVENGQVNSVNNLLCENNLSKLNSEIQTGIQARSCSVISPTINLPYHKNVVDNVDLMNSLIPSELSLQQPLSVENNINNGRETSKVNTQIPDFVSYDETFKTTSIHVPDWLVKEASNDKSVCEAKIHISDNLITFSKSEKMEMSNSKSMSKKNTSENDSVMLDGNELKTSTYTMNSTQGCDHCVTKINQSGEMNDSSSVKEVRWSLPNQTDTSINEKKNSDKTNESLSSQENNCCDCHVNLVNNSNKPKGSAVIFVKMSVGTSPEKVDANVSVDTGADFTICDSAFLIENFGNDALKHIYQPGRLPRLKSASGHYLELLGKVKVTLHLGEYELTLRAIVDKSDTNKFLLGSDAFYEKLIYDRGKFLAFADNKYPPIPIHYELPKRIVQVVSQYQIAPKTKALIQVKVTDNAKLTGKQVVLTPLDDHDPNCKHHNCEFDNPVCRVTSSPVKDSVSIIDSHGNAFVLVDNDTEDILTILPETEIAYIEFVSEDDDYIKLVEQSDELNNKKECKCDQKWPASALKNELADKLPKNVIVQWHNVISHERDCENNKNNKNKISNSKNLVDDVPYNVNYVHDKEERKNLLDGTGEGFPSPPSADSIHPEQYLSDDPDAWLENVDRKHLSEQEWEKLKTLLLKYRDAFSKTKTEIGCCNYFKVDLPLKPGTGILHNKPRPLAHKFRKAAAEITSELLAKGVIRLSKSPHSTNIVCVKKKTMQGVVSHRICCDLRQVNEHSIPNRFPNPWIEDAMEKLQGAAYRTAVDFKDAFHMLVLNDDSMAITAFFVDNVLYEYTRLPFGHVNAMNSFCMLMALLCVGYSPASYYADDLMITTKKDHNKSKDELYELHLTHIEGILERIIHAGLKLVAHKCQWCYTADRPMDWLGFTMENNLLKPQESKVKVIKEYPTPTTAKQIIAFISTGSFNRRFFPNFASIVRPMYEVANKEPFYWTEEAQKSFEKIKEMMSSDMALRLPRQGEPFQLYSDASFGAIGVVLCQKDPADGKSHPCAYGSRKFNDAELKLSIPCKELLAIVYGLNLWSFYICGNPVQVFSDCRAWTYIRAQNGNAGRTARLTMVINEFDITVSYIKGTSNRAADGLSRAFDDGLTQWDDLTTARHPAVNLLEAPELQPGEAVPLVDYMEKCDKFLVTHWPEIMKKYEIQQIQKGEKADFTGLQTEVGKPQKLCNIEKDILSESEYVDQVIQEAAILHVDRGVPTSWNLKRRKGNYLYEFNDDFIDEGFQSHTESVESDDELTESDVDIDDTTDSVYKAACFNIKLVALNESCFSFPAFADMQRKDEYCSIKFDLLKKKDNRTINAGYFLKKGVLLRKMETKDKQPFEVLCIPRVLVRPLMESTHRTLMSGHFGGSRYFLDMSRKYYWKGMKEDITDFQHQCLPCQYNDKFPLKHISGNVIRPSYPMHIVHCDLIVGLPKAKNRCYAILLMYDGFSRFTFGIPLSSEKADYVVEKYNSHFTAAFGKPWALHSDNGRNVDGALIRHLALMLGVLKTSTPPHNPNSNPTETMCGAVSMLIRKALQPMDKGYWPLCLPFILRALNSTVHTATGYTPNSLFFGRPNEPEPVPLIPFTAKSANVNEYFKKMRRFQELAFQIVRKRNERKILARKAKWDSTAKIHHYKEGDFILVKNNNPASGPGKMKLRAKYLGPFRVIKAYMSSLICVPWTENARLEEYYKDPDVFRLMHRGDIKPFHTRQVAVKHCKPFRGNIDDEQIIDPIMLNKFLDMVGIDSKEVESEIDPDSYSRRAGNVPSSFDSESTRSQDDFDDDDSQGDDDPDSPDSDDEPPPIGPLQPVGVVQPDVPAELDDQRDDHEQAEDENQEVVADLDDETEVDLDDNLEISRRDRKLLDKYYHDPDSSSTSTMRTRSHGGKLKELELLIRSPDQNVRHKAEHELTAALEQIKRDLGISIDDVGDSSSESDEGKMPLSDREQTGDSEKKKRHQSKTQLTETFVSAESVVDRTERDFDMPSMEWDDDPREESPRNQTQEINIRMPNVAVSIRPSGRGACRGPTTSTPKLPRQHVGRGRQDIQDWLSQASPHRGAEPVTPVEKPPVVTRHGRISKPPERYGYTPEVERQKELRNVQKALDLSKSEARQQRRREAGSGADDIEMEPVPSTSAQASASAQARPKTEVASKAATTKKSASRKE